MSFLPDTERRRRGEEEGEERGEIATVEDEEACCYTVYIWFVNYRGGGRYWCFSLGITEKQPVCI